MDEQFETTQSCAMILGTLFLQSPKEGNAAAEIAKSLCEMRLSEEWPFGNEEELAQAAALFAQAKDETDYALGRAYHHLFVGPGPRKAAPWGSVYLDSEAVVFGDSCLLLVRWMRANGIALFEDESREPVDHIGRIFVLLAWLCENNPELIEEFLRLHVLPWSDKFFDRLDAANEGPFYAGLSKLARATLTGIYSQVSSLEEETQEIV